MRVWRLSRHLYAEHPLDGEGARLYGGRWNFPGTPLVYTAGSLALAALEVLVHVDTDLAPTDLFAISLDLPRGLRIETITREMLPANWQRTPAAEELQELGTAWITRATSAVLRVPSAVIPEEDNYLINPVHPDCRRIKPRRPQAFTFDHRLLK